MGKYKIRARTVLVLAFITTLALAIGPTIRTLAAETIFKIQNAELASISDGAEGSITSYDDSNIVSNVVFHKLNDSAAYKITLKNSDNKDHIIETITDDNENSYISYSYNKHENELISAGNNLIFDLTATYSTANADPSARIQSTNVKFYIQFVDVGEPVEIDLDVPNTGANGIAKSTAAKDQDLAKAVLPIVIFASAGLIVVAIIAVKKHKKFAKITAAFVIAGSAFAIAANVKAVVTEINSFTITTEYGLYDKLIIHNGDEDVIIDYGKKLEDINEIVEPTKPGYTFEGWEDENGNDIDPNNPIVNDVTIRPKFTAITYTIKYNGNGAPADQQMPDQVLTYDQAQNLTTNNFTWDGHNFSGWDTTITGNGTYYADGQEVKNLTTTNNDVITLYAQWSANPYHIEYNANGGTGEMAVTNCEYDHDCVLRQNTFTKYGYDFEGWTFDNNNYDDEATVRNLATSGTITMVAKWEAHEYQITYTGLTDAEAAALRTAGNPDFYTIETQSFQLHNPADRKDNDGDTTQMFLGWREITTITPVIILPMQDYLGDKTFEAVWQDKAFPRYDITYNLDGGEVATANPATHDKTETFTLNNPTKAGYTFVGWTGTTIEGDTPVHDYTLPAPHVRSAIEFTAHYRANTYTVNFDINTDDTSVSGTMQPLVLNYDEEKALTANTFTRTGYTFAGWELGDTEYTDGQTVKNLTAEDGATVTLYAKWSPIHYTIVFHENSDGVTGDMANQVFAYDEAKNLTQNAFIKNHYKFMGWTTVANGTGTKYDDQASIFNLTTEDGATIDLYAQWKERTAYLKGTVNNSWGSAGDMIRSLQGYSAATSFSHYEGEPNFDEIGTKLNMAISSSNFPVYTWIDGETIYWWSEAETIYAHEDSRNFFSGLKKAETIDYSGFNFSLTKNLAGFFKNTAALSTIDLSPLAAANPTTLEEMFYGSGIASVDLSPLDTTQTINMKGMFDGTTALETVNLSAIDTTNVTDMSYLFNNSANLKSVDFSHNNLSSVENMSNMFRSDKKLESLNFTGVNTPNLKKMSWMFGGAKIASLDLSDLDTENVTHFDELFYYADVANLDISGFDTHNATTFGSMFTSFNAHGQVLDLSHFDTTSLNGSMYEMFNRTNASVIDLSSFDISAERAANIGMVNILNIANNVETIYATEKLHLHDYSSDPDTSLGVPMDYGGQSKLVGGAGSTLRQLTLLGLSEYDKARIDDPCNGKPGMFAVKNAQYICFNANYDGADSATAGQYVSTTATDRLMENPFTRPGYRLVGWAESADGAKVYDNEGEITITTSEKSPKQLYAVWAEITAMLNTGVSVRAALLDIAGEATSFEHYPNGIPNLDEIENKREIQANNSEAKVYVWNDAEAGKIYWYSDAKTPKFNPASYRMFEGLSSLTKIDLTGLDASTATNLSRLFYGDTALTSTNIAALDTSNVTDMSHMFRNTGFTELNLEGLETGNVTNMTCMFAGTTNLNSINLSPLNTAKVENMSYLLNGSGVSSVNLTSLDTSNLTNMADMFNGTTNLETVDLSPLNVQKVTTMAGLFEKSGISSINLAPLATESVTNLSRMFNQAPNLTTLDVSPLITKNVTDMSDMFLGVKLDEIDVSNFDTSSATNLARIFGTMGVKTIYVSNKFVIDETDNITNALMHNKIRGGANSGIYEGNCNSAQCYPWMRIDDPDNNGVGSAFTYKNARYIRYNGNGADNATPYGAMRSHYITTDATNPNGLATKLTKNAYTREGYIFRGWATSAEDAAAGTVTYADEDTNLTAIEAGKVPYVLYAVWKEAVADFVSVTDLRTQILDVTGNWNDIKQFVPYRNTPNLDELDYRIVSTVESDFPIYIWYDSSNGAVYYWCEWSKPKMYGELTDLFSTTANIEIVDLSEINLENITSVNQLFAEKTKLRSVDFGDWTASNVTDMYRMFYYASSLESVDLSHFNTTSLQGSLEGMFDHCSSLQSIDFGNNFNTSNITNMSTMFLECSSLTELDLSSFNTSSVTNMQYMFQGCTSLQSINFGENFNTANVTNMGWMFFQDTSLTTLDLSTFSSASLSTATAMFRFAPLKTIYVTDSFKTDGLGESAVNGQMLFADTSLIGGAGTSFAATNHKGSDYGRLDDPDNNKPGFFTMKDARYIRYNNNGADGTEEMTSHYLTNTGSLKTNVFTSTGKKFTGWNTAADGTGTPYTDGQAMTGLVESKTPLTLYAQWQNSLPTITYNANGGTGSMATQSANAGASIELNAPEFRNEGYGYAGWNTEPDGTGTSYGPREFIYMPNTDTTLYAQWITPEQGVTLQTFDKENYASSPNNTILALRDERDNEVYAIAKMADGNWWMIENLRLNFSNPELQITAQNTNNPTGSFINKANAHPANSVPTMSDWCSDKSLACYNEIRYLIPNKRQIDGAYYNIFTATAGNLTSSTPMGYNDAQGDICPAGWRAPIGNTWEDRTRGDFSKLNMALGGASTDENLRSTEAMNRFVGFPFNLVTAGSTPTDVSDPEYYERNGALWTMSTYPGAMYYVLFDIYNVHLNMATTGQGYQIRCLTK